MSSAPPASTTGSKWSPGPPEIPRCRKTRGFPRTGRRPTRPASTIIRSDKAGRPSRRSSRNRWPAAAHRQSRPWVRSAGHGGPGVALRRWQTERRPCQRPGPQRNRLPGRCVRGTADTLKKPESVRPTGVLPLAEYGIAWIASLPPFGHQGIAGQTGRGHHGDLPQAYPGCGNQPG